jgi:hypothetical protein
MKIPIKSANLEQIAVYKMLASIKLEDLKEISERSSVLKMCGSKDGGGLLTGASIDILFTEELFPRIFGEQFVSYHNGEADMKFKNASSSGEIAVSLKTLSGPGEVAMCWSKNPSVKSDGTNCLDRIFWQHPLIIYYSGSGQWWKSGPKEPIDDADFTKLISKGLYVVDNNSAKEWVTFEQNNKTNFLVNKQSVYLLLQQAFKRGFFISVPEPTGFYEATKRIFVGKDGSEHR